MNAVQNTVLGKGPFLWENKLGIGKLLAAVVTFDKE